MPSSVIDQIMICRKSHGAELAFKILQNFGKMLGQMFANVKIGFVGLVA
jgi:hypothetical protein